MVIFVRVGVLGLEAGFKEVLQFEILSKRGIDGLYLLIVWRDWRSMAFD